MSDIRGRPNVFWIFASKGVGGESLNAALLNWLGGVIQMAMKKTAAVNIPEANQYGLDTSTHSADGRKA
jgi:hypothetical protein